MSSDPRKNWLENYARYSAMAIQMMVIILAGVFGGYKLDQWLHCKPVFTLILSFGSVIAAIYLVTRDLIKKKKNEN
ncbi:MAG: AtpZ/AtpI family protein [Bacteroidota bacterium]|nr:AtpZ/AtpI family protein [Bacteroidota bacterium]